MLPFKIHFFLWLLWLLQTGELHFIVDLKWKYQITQNCNLIPISFALMYINVVIQKQFISIEI